ncbi:unnamed protein product [Taenia asiatica]|uniref:Uncharacterized protein n=1 Tax=Taenia asiatica TaxID=60517 RepID=A0A3P6NYD5_TAEAS|nr:unnamed protein product [Taenia asiatica]
MYFLSSVLKLIYPEASVVGASQGNHWRHGDYGDTDYFGRQHGYYHHRDDDDHDHDDHDDDHDDDDDDDDDDRDDRDRNKTVLIGASGGGNSRRVMWHGSSSYPGYRHYSRRPSHRPPVPPRSYMSKRGLITPSPPVRPVQLHNKERARDPRYRQGLQELRDLIDVGKFTSDNIVTAARKIYNLILLFALICFVLTVQARPHHVSKKSYHGASAVRKGAKIPVEFKSVARKSVLWSGASSYPGYRDNRRRRHRGENVKAPSVKPIEPITVQLHNKERANDARYREGLQELASLM